MAIPKHLTGNKPFRKPTAALGDGNRPASEKYKRKQAIGLPSASTGYRSAAREQHSRTSDVTTKLSNIHAEYQQIEIYRVERESKERDAKQHDDFMKMEARIDARFAQVDARFDKVDARFAQVDARFAQVDARFARVDEQFVEVRKEIADLRIDMTERISDVRKEISDVRKEISDVRIDLSKEIRNVGKWIIGMVFSVLLIVLSAIGAAVFNFLF